MKVALVAQSLDERRGGAETSTLQFARHLLRAGVEVHLITRRPPTAASGFTVHIIGRTAYSRALNARRFTDGVDRFLLQGRFDVVHAVSPCRGADIYQPRGGTVRESLLRNLALHHTSFGRLIKSGANHLNRKQRYLLALERALLLNPQGPLIVAISQYVARQVREHYGLPEERLRIVFNGVDLGASTPEESARSRQAVRGEFGIGPRDCLVLLIAHNFRLKGIARWMEAHALLVKRGAGNVQSVVVGDGPIRSWQRRANRMGLAGHLTFAGPRPSVRAFHDAADVFVHPTFYDPCSRVVLEALAAGLPCVTTKWDGASEMVRNGRNGYVLDDPWDSAALADRVDRLRDPAVRGEFGRAALAMAERVSMKRHTVEMLALYEHCLARRRS